MLGPCTTSTIFTNAAHGRVISLGIFQTIFRQTFPSVRIQTLILTCERSSSFSFQFLLKVKFALSLISYVRLELDKKNGLIVRENDIFFSVLFSRFDNKILLERW